MEVTIYAPGKKSYNITWSGRTGSKDKFYHGMCESPVRKKNKLTKHPDLSEPLVSRVQSQQYIGLPKEKPKSTYPIINMVKKEKATVIKMERTSDSDSGEDTELLVDIDQDQTKTDIKEKLITCSLKTTTYGLKKSTSKRRVRSYRCPDCRE